MLHVQDNEFPFLLTKVTQPVAVVVVAVAFVMSSMVVCAIWFGCISCSKSKLRHGTAE